MSQPIQKFVNDLFAAWNAHDVDQAEKFYAENYEGFDMVQAASQQGRAGARAFFSQYLSAVPDFQFTIEDVVSDGNRVAVS